MRWKARPLNGWEPFADPQKLKEDRMIRALFSAASGMVAQQLNVDNTANNLANANTTGFKHRRVQFQDLLYQNLVAPGTASGPSTRSVTR